MDDNKRAYVSMAEKVDTFLQLKATELAATTADVASLQTNLHSKIDETLDNDTQANLDNSGQTVAKNTERTELLESTRRVIPYLVKYFLSVPNQRMADRINFNKSELENMDDNKFYENAKLVYDTAHVTATLTAIVALGYTNLLHTAHNTNLGEFRDLIGTPRMLTGDASSYNRAVERNISDLHNLLDQLDKEINLIEFDFTILFDGYYAVRGIDDAGSGSSNTVTDVVDGGGTKKVRTIAYDPTSTITMKVTGTVAVAFSFKAGGADVGMPVKVEAGTQQTKTHLDFATSGDELWAASGSTTEPASYKVTFN